VWKPFQGKIHAPANRGVLLDCVVFLVNLALLTVLSHLLRNLFNESHEDAFAKAEVALYCGALTFLQPAGALLKRRRAHQRLSYLAAPEPGCLFHPILYFLSKLIFLIAAAGNLVELLYGGQTSESADYFGLPPWLFMTLFLGVPALAAANTAVVYFYFHAPKHAPLLKFLDTPRAETLGDVCLFLNMIGHQMFWGILMSDLPRDYSTILGRLSTFFFAAVFVYFPPRLLYLAEDGDRPLTWLMMLLANSPVLVRILFA
jgi:hypothetical protein